MRRLIFNWLFVTMTVLSIFVSACSPKPSTNLEISNKPRITNPNISPDDTTALVAGNNSFALNLYHSLRASDGNLIFSPFSISLALAMTYAGARGETESQISKTLHFDLPQAQLHPAINGLDLALRSAPIPPDEHQEPLQLNIANAVWAEQAYPFLQDFLDLIAANYGAGIRLADFINAYEPTRKEINAWVEDQTNDKIKDLIPEGILDELTRMVLVNAIYFKADWLETFDKNSTTDVPFHLLDGTEILVPTMSQEMYNLPYASGDGYQAVELTYAGNTAAMDILVPEQGQFDNFQTSLDSQKLDAILSGMQGTAVSLRLPKFNYTVDFNLSEKLKTMGMPDAFDPERADFTGMSNRRDLYITDVLHKAYVAVDEEGTEAAAATAVIVGVTSAPMANITLTIDRPFIFLIRDLPSGQILFMGRVLNPRLN